MEQRTTEIMVVLVSHILDYLSGMVHDICVSPQSNKKDLDSQVFFVFYSITFDQTSKCSGMKKTDLEQLVKDLVEMNKYLIKENEELKKEVKKGKEIFLETIDKWNQSVDRLTRLK